MQMGPKASPPIPDALNQSHLVLDDHPFAIEHFHTAGSKPTLHRRRGPQLNWPVVSEMLSTTPEWSLSTFDFIKPKIPLVSARTSPLLICMPVESQSDLTSPGGTDKRLAILIGMMSPGNSSGHHVLAPTVVLACTITSPRKGKDAAVASNVSVVTLSPGHTPVPLRILHQ